MAIGDIERLGEFARTGTEAAHILQTAPRFHQCQTTPRFERANQYKPAAFAAFDEKIQHPVDAVIKIDVNRAGFVALDERSRAPAREGMTCLVVQGEIRLRFDDKAGAFSPNEFRADEFPRADERV